MGYRYAREIRSQIDQICNAFWSGGISNPLEVIEQSTYLLFLRRLDELETLEERKATQRKPPMERRIFPAGEDRLKRPYDQFRWSRLPVPADAGRRDSTYANHLKDARFTIPTPQLLAKVVDLLDKVRWRTATPRSTFTSTCSARSPRQGEMGSSGRRAA